MVALWSNAPVIYTLFLADDFGLSWSRCRRRCGVQYHVLYPHIFYNNPLYHQYGEHNKQCASLLLARSSGLCAHCHCLCMWCNTNGSLRIGSLLYVMLALFVASMAYFIYSIRDEIQKRKKKLLEESATDLMPYVRYAQTSLTILYISAAFMPIVILFNTLLLYVGPLMLLIIVFFVHSFVSLGYYISPDDNIINEQDELVEQIDNADIKDEELKVQAPQELLSQERLKQIETALRNGVKMECIKTAM